MGVWTEVRGTVWISPDSGCSLSKLCKELYDECVVKVEHNKTFNPSQTLYWAFEDGGSKADSIINNFIERLLEYDKRARVDITASIRYIN